MSTSTPPKTGSDVMAQFIPASPFVSQLDIVAEVLDGDEVRLRLPALANVRRSARMGLEYWARHWRQRRFNA